MTDLSQEHCSGPFAWLYQEVTLEKKEISVQQVFSRIVEQRMQQELLDGKCEVIGWEAENLVARLRAFIWTEKVDSDVVK